MSEVVSRPLHPAVSEPALIGQKCSSARGVVVIFVRQQNVAQMAFAEYHDMIDAFPAD